MSCNSLMNRGLTINPPPYPPTRIAEKWDLLAAPEGSDSPSQSSFQTLSTGQVSLAIPPARMARNFSHTLLASRH
jgi:hypothetical protein